jgi:hypothetical protein
MNPAPIEAEGKNPVARTLTDASSSRLCAVRRMELIASAIAIA